MTKKKTKKKKQKPAKAEMKTKLKSEPAKTTPYPAAGKKIVDFEQKLDEQIDPKKPVRGRPRKTPAQAPPEPEFQMTVDMVGQGIKMPFDLWAATNKLPALKLTDPESKMLSAPVKQLLDYYFPGAPVIAIAWISLAVTSYSIMAIRLKLIADVKKKKSSLSSENQMDEKPVAGGQGSPRPSGFSATETSTVRFPSATEPEKL